VRLQQAVLAAFCSVLNIKLPLPNGAFLSLKISKLPEKHTSNSLIYQLFLNNGINLKCRTPIDIPNIWFKFNVELSACEHTNLGIGHRSLF